MIDTSSKLTGVYKAIVTDVSCFPTTGKIKTKIAAFKGNSVPSNLLSGNSYYNGYDSSSFRESTYRDIYTYIIVPFGGGSNAGAFKLPEVNSLGVVTFINNNPNLPLWLGGISAYYMDEGSLLSVDYPSDNLDNNEGMLYREGGSSTSELKKNYTDENSFVLKTKTNTLNDYNNPSTMNWRENQVENAVIMNSVKAHVYHRIADSSYAEIYVQGNEKTDPSAYIGYIDDKNKIKSYAKFDDRITISTEEDDSSASIYLDNDSRYGITINTSDGSGNSSASAEINLTPTELSLSVGGSGESSRIILSRLNGEVSISAKNVRITADNISLGDTGFYLVASPAPVAMTLEDGTTLVTASNIKV